MISQVHISQTILYSLQKLLLRVPQNPEPEAIISPFPQRWPSGGGTEGRVWHYTVGGTHTRFRCTSST